MATLRNFIIATVIVGLCMVARVDGKRGGCKMFQYYDEHMDSCGPCREICHQMKKTRTEHQCQTQCSDYLIAATCTYRQYYDDIVKACGPCSEICDHSDLKGTTQECGTKCQDYLKALNCTDEEYFEEEDKECAACSELCSQRDEHGNTTQECFRKCLKYTEKYSSLISSGDMEAKTGLGNKSSLPSGSPGIVVAIIVMGLIIIAATIGLVAYMVRGRHVYTPANSVDGNVDDNQTEDEVASAFIQMVELPAGSTPEQAAPASVLTSGQAEGQNEENPTAVAVQEQNPYASGRYCLHNPDLRESVL